MNKLYLASRYTHGVTANQIYKYTLIPHHAMPKILDKEIVPKFGGTIASMGTWTRS